MPNSQTMRRAISVARSMSLPAPLVICRRNSSSAMRPPIRIAICASRNSRVCVCRSPSGSCIVTPSARPRGMIVTLCSGSACGSSAATTACPDSWYAQVTRSCSVIVQRLALDAHQHLVARLIEIAVGHDLPAAAHGEQRRLVHEIRELGAREAGRAARDLPQIDFADRARPSSRGSGESARGP